MYVKIRDVRAAFLSLANTSLAIMLFFDCLTTADVATQTVILTSYFRPLNEILRLHHVSFSSYSTNDRPTISKHGVIAHILISISRNSTFYEHGRRTTAVHDYRHRSLPLITRHPCLTVGFRIPRT